MIASKETRRNQRIREAHTHISRHAEIFRKVGSVFCKKFLAKGQFFKIFTENFPEEETEEKLRKMGENNMRMRKCSSLAHPIEVERLASPFVLDLVWETIFGYFFFLRVHPTQYMKFKNVNNINERLPFPLAGLMLSTVDSR